MSAYAYLWVLIALLLIPFVIYTAFLALCTVRSVQAQGVEFPDGMHTIAEIWFVIGLPADLLFNWTWGVLIFGELLGTTFSSHVQKRVDLALIDPTTRLWSNFLNASAPRHIKRVPAGWIV